MTGPWRPLPAALDPEIAYLVGVLREMKDACGLSLATLAPKTVYSKSSWDRCLNGKALPPWQAVAALAELAGQPVERVRALWERAETQWTRRAIQARPATAETEPVVTEPVPDRSPSSHPRLSGWVFASSAAVLVVAVFAVLARSFGLLGADASRPSYPVGCHGTQCTGQQAYGMDCGIDAKPFAYLRTPDADLELMISDVCGAAWAQLSHSAAGNRVQVADQTGHSETITVSDDSTAAQYVTTKMIAADRNSHVRACVQVREAEPQCTAWGANSPVTIPSPSPGWPTVGTPSKN